MKNLTNIDVLEILNKQTENGEPTTTLEVKKEARKQGFWAKQREVSMMIQNLIDSGKVTIAGDNGTHRFYSPVIKPKTPVVPGPAKLVHTVNHHNGTASKVTAIPQRLTNKGDWEVSSIVNPEVMYFLGDLTRDEVRSAYSKMNSVSFVATRSKRVS